MMRVVAGLVCLVGLVSQPAFARELTDAPDAEIIGFSPDGRYFAYEQYAWDIVSDAVYSAVFVIDRETNALVPDFPIGLVPEEIDGKFPGSVGSFEPDPALIDTGDGTPDLIGLREAVLAEASVRLDALGIGMGGRRLAGIPITQRKPSVADHPLVFVLAPSLPGAVPDGQESYAIEATSEVDPANCYDAGLPARTKSIAFDVIATTPDLKETGRITTAYQWAMSAESCEAGIWVSDIFAPPAQPESGAAVAVLFLTQVWRPGVDEAGWHALFVKLPE